MITTSSPQPTSPQTPKRSRWLIALLSVALAAALVAVGLLVARDNTTEPAGSASVSPTPTTSALQSPSTSRSALPLASPPVVVPKFQLGYQPLFPFANRDDVLVWLRSYHSGGHAPWHVNAAQTAQAFTVGFLGYGDINQITSQASDRRGAHIGVGYRDPNGTAHTAAVLHLVRFGPETDAPWEVVGTDDTTFSIETPAYGSRVTSPVIVGGHITGVDENIHVTVRQLSGQRPLGQSDGIPAGGDNQPWSATVDFAGASDRTLTVVATTGGHQQQVERFAVQGVRY
jgi:hypothetical protein